MISQPELGNRIIELRRTKGLTQEELIEKCNISVRTLQRIEAGEVTPRNSTIRLIFEALEINHSTYFESTQLDDEDLDSKVTWYRQMYLSFIDLFHLRTNTLKKLIILTILLSLIIISILLLNNTLSLHSDPLPQIQRSTGVK